MNLCGQTANHPHVQCLLLLNDPKVACHRSRCLVHQEGAATEAVAMMISTVGSLAKGPRVIAAAREHQKETREIRMDLRVGIGTIVRDLGGLLVMYVILVRNLAAKPDVSLWVLSKCLALKHLGMMLAPQTSVSL